MLMMSLAATFPSASLAQSSKLPSESTVSSPDQLVSEIDELLRRQDEAAAGSIDSVPAQKQLLLKIASGLSNASPSQYPRLAPATIAYVLSGGDPDIAERLSANTSLSAEEQQLLRASAHLMSGDREDAAPLFASIDTLSLPGRLSGRVALAQALLLQGDARQERYAVAIATMPGTLVEESALRRSALDYAEARDEGQLWKRLERYARRYPFSVYATNFWEDIMLAVAKWGAKNKAPSLERLDFILSLLPASQRRVLYLTLARAAAASGQAELTGFAGRRLRRLSADGTVEDLQGAFFIALYGVVTADGDGALQTLRTVPRDILNNQDRALLDSALSLGLQIERPSQLSNEGEDESTTKWPLESRGSELLTKADSLMSGINR